MQRLQGVPDQQLVLLEPDPIRIELHRGLSVTGSTCKIIELKPDNDAAKAMGDEQKNAYVLGLRNWFADKKEDS